MSDQLFVAHLEMIQGVIARMASNSFLLKGWAITVVSGLIALAINDREPRFAVLALLPTGAFWWLDAYYLHCEHRYRQLFDLRRQDPARERLAPFALSTSELPGSTIPAAARTPAVLLLYLALAAVAVAVSLVL